MSRRSSGDMSRRRPRGRGGCLVQSGRTGRRSRAIPSSSLASSSSRSCTPQAPPTLRPLCLLSDPRIVRAAVAVQEFGLPPALRLGQVIWNVQQSGPAPSDPGCYELVLASDGLVGYFERVALAMRIEPLQHEHTLRARLSVTLSWSAVSPPLALLRWPPACPPPCFVCRARVLAVAMQSRLTPLPWRPTLRLVCSQFLSAGAGIVGGSEVQPASLRTQPLVSLSPRALPARSFLALLASGERGKVRAHASAVRVANPSASPKGICQCCLCQTCTGSVGPGAQGQ